MINYFFNRTLCFPRSSAPKNATLLQVDMNIQLALNCDCSGKTDCISVDARRSKTGLWVSLYQISPPLWVSTSPQYAAMIFVFCWYGNAAGEYVLKADKKVKSPFEFTYNGLKFINNIRGNGDIYDYIRYINTQ